MKYVEAPQDYEYQLNDGQSIFLAGGITGCPDWQAAVRRELKNTRWTVFNPRRANFPMHDPSAAEEQIRWEHTHLRLAHVILFWFPAEAIQPIALYELGAWTMTRKAIFVGVHPNYPRRQDVEIQTRLARPEIKVKLRLDELIYTLKELL